MHILIATDADWIVEEITAALGGPDTHFTVCRDGRAVPKVVSDRTPDLAILDLQVGSMGGMAITMALRLDESGGTAPHVSAIMLLDRAADVHLARRSGADGWLIKPLDPLRLRRALMAVTQGGTYYEGLPEDASIVTGPVDDVTRDGSETDLEDRDVTEEEPAPAG